MKMPSHMFLPCNGDLHDTRSPNWSANPLRTGYAYAHRNITNARELCATLRAGPYAWPGGYEFVYLTSDGGCLSTEAVRDNLRSVIGSIRTQCNDGWRVVAVFTTAEGDMDDIICDHTGRVIYSAEQD